MSEKRVVITLGKDGSVKTEAFGFKGASCQEKTKFLEKIFGEAKATLKPSFYEEDTESEKDIIVNGLPSGHCG